MLTGMNDWPPSRVGPLTERTEQRLPLAYYRHLGPASLFVCKMQSIWSHILQKKHQSAICPAGAAECLMFFQGLP